MANETLLQTSIDLAPYFTNVVQDSHKILSEISVNSRKRDAWTSVKVAFIATASRGCLRGYTSTCSRSDFACFCF